LCCRELQNSITESVHKVLSDQILALGQGAFYEVQANRILGKNGTTFSFEGIKNNSTKVKSYEGIDYCWVEEGDKVSKASWEILLPTIRKKGAEIWVSFNPSLAEDYTYKTFVMDPDLVDLGDGVKESDDMVVVKMTYRDNPWFGDTSLLPLMEKTKRNDPDAWLNIWDGNPLEHLEGAVYAKQLRLARAEGRICQVPWEKEIPVSTAWDVGRADATAIWFYQKVAFQNRILAYFEDSLQDDVSYYIKECQRRGYTYERLWLPHDAKAKRLGTKRSIYEQIRAVYPFTEITPGLSIADGINAVRLIFGNCWFDESLCEDGLKALRHYRYKIVDGQLSKEPKHDDASHGADAFRYLALVIGKGRGQSTVTIAQRLEIAAKSTASAVLSKLSGISGGDQTWLGR
jgi:phage terminase large subunit